MGQHTETTFSLAGSIGTTSEGTAESAFVSAERGFGLPPLAVDSLVPTASWLLPKSLDHLTPICGLGPLPPTSTAIERDHRGPHLEILTSVAVVFLSVECRIGQNTIPGHGQRCLGHRWAELRRVVGWASGDGCTGEEVALGVTSNSEFGPKPGCVLASGSLEEVSRRVPTFQSRAVHGSGWFVADQAAFGCRRSGTHEEANDLPFFNSLPAA